MRKQLCHYTIVKQHVVSFSELALLYSSVCSHIFGHQRFSCTWSDFQCLECCFGIQWSHDYYRKHSSKFKMPRSYLSLLILLPGHHLCCYHDFDQWYFDLYKSWNLQHWNQHNGCLKTHNYSMDSTGSDLRVLSIFRIYSFWLRYMSTPRYRRKVLSWLL